MLVDSSLPSRVREVLSLPFLSCFPLKVDLLYCHPHFQIETKHCHIPLVLNTGPMHLTSQAIS